jgi:phosphatidate cytidylyltransferase
VTALGRRLLIALWGIPLLLGTAYAGGWSFRIVVALLAVVACFEAFRLVAPGAPTIAAWPTYLAALVLPLYLHAGPESSLAFAYLACGLATAVTAVLLRSGEGARAGAGALILPIYPLLPLLYLGWLRESFGWPAVFFLFLILWAGDTAAYAGGRLTGRHPLAPDISPRKTVEGAAWALLFSLVAAFILQHYFWPHLLGPAGALLGATIIWSLGMTGDLFESLLKRHVGVKDSSHLLSEHGGVLDRFDSLLFACAPFYYLLRWWS